MLVWFLGTEDELWTVKLAAVAVALRCRGKRYGDEAMEVALAAAAEEAQSRGARAAFVQGLVDYRNVASKAMNVRAGVQFYDLDESEQYELWGRELPPIVDELGP